MSKIFLKDAKKKDMTDKYLRYDREMFETKTCFTHAQCQAEIGLRNAWYILEICLKLVWKIPEISLIYVWDKMTALWQNDCLTFTSYDTFSNIIPKYTTFVKDFFGFDD